MSAAVHQATTNESDKLSIGPQSSESLYDSSNMPDHEGSDSDERKDAARKLDFASPNKCPRSFDEFELAANGSALKEENPEPVGTAAAAVHQANGEERRTNGAADSSSQNSINDSGGKSRRKRKTYQPKKIVQEVALSEIAEGYQNGIEGVAYVVPEAATFFAAAAAAARNHQPQAAPSNQAATAGSSSNSKVEAPPVLKRKRGRPRKVPLPTDLMKPKRRPGRPRKDEQNQFLSLVKRDHLFGSDAVSLLTKRKREKPRKFSPSRVDEGEGGEEKPVKKKRGRPRKHEKKPVPLVRNAEGQLVPLKRKRGRPRKEHTLGGGGLMLAHSSSSPSSFLQQPIAFGAPNAFLTSSASVPSLQPARRGRPPKQKIATITGGDDGGVSSDQFLRRKVGRPIKYQVRTGLNSLSFSQLPIANYHHHHTEPSPNASTSSSSSTAALSSQRNKRKSNRPVKIPQTDAMTTETSTACDGTTPDDATSSVFSLTDH